MIGRHRGMSPAAVRINHHRVRLREFLGRRPFRIQMKFHIHTIRGTLLEAFGEELNARVVLVFTRTVRRTASDHQDILLCVSSEDMGAERGANEQDEREFFHGDGELAENHAGREQPFGFLRKTKPVRRASFEKRACAKVAGRTMRLSLAKADTLSLRNLVSFR